MHVKNKTKYFFKKGIKYSSTKILNNHFSKLDKNTLELLKKINKKYSNEIITKTINSINNKKIILTGESI